MLSYLLALVQIFPFKGILYNTKKVKKPDQVMAPPYEIISPEEQDELYQANDYNVVRLILGQEFPDDSEYNNRYLRAAAFFKGWMHHEILKEDEKPAIYFYEQRFIVYKKKYVRQGFIALLRLEDINRGRVYPHENTLSKPKRDRLELLSACSANFENIFTIYSDEKLKTIKPFKKYLRRKPIIEVKDKNKTTHRLWRIDSKPVILKIMKEMKDKPVFIADGHHRYEASLNFRNEMRMRNTRFSEDESYNHIMAYFTPMEGQGLVVFPIHRLVKLPSYTNFDFQRFQEELEIHFEIENFPFVSRSEKKARKKVLAEFTKRGAKKHIFIFLVKGSNRYQLLTLRDTALTSEMLPESKSEAFINLDVTILQSIVFKKILNIEPENGLTFIKDADQAFNKVLNGENDMAIIVNPPKLKDIIEVSQAFEKMPQKSTYFYPKLLSGLVMSRIELNEKVTYEEKGPE